MPGKDPDGLPRYPGSTRTEYGHERIEGLERTRAEYAADADPDEIRTFYRESFAAGGWTVADLGFSPEEWYFFVVSDEREALVEIHTTHEPLVVRIELTAPGSGGAPVQPAPAPSPAGVEDEEVYDDEEEAEDYEGGDG